MSKGEIFNKTELSNKITLLTEEIPNSQSFALGFFLKVGSRNDPKGLEGLAHFTEHSAFLNTKKRTYRQIATQFESLGAYTNAYTSKEYTCFYVRALNKHFNKTFQLLADIVLNPEYKSKLIEKEKQIIIEEIKSYKDDPEELIFDLVDEMTFYNNGLSNPIVGREESVSKIGVKNLEFFHKSYYVPSNIVISCSGGLPYKTVLNACSKYLNNIEVKENKKNEYEKLNTEILKSRYFKFPFHQSHIVLSCLTEGLKSKDRYPLTILNILLGDGMSSRIYQLLREKHGLAYTSYSTLNLMSDCGALYIYSCVDKSKTDRTLCLIEKEFEKLLKFNIKQSELKRAKEQAKTSILLSLESLNNRMQRLAYSEIVFGTNESVNSMTNEINKIKLDDLVKVINKYLDMNNWNRVIIDPKD